VYRIAHRHGLKGFVRNHSRGVTIEVEGSDGALQSFLEDLKTQRPPLAQITHLDIAVLPLAHYERFEIQGSQTQADRFTLISPDIAVCEDCLREMRDPEDRRFRYPFINCTNCGPRYTITADVPYDRPNTSMAKFTMCPDCQQEYDNPANRRFHAQPNACPRCGPRVWLVDNQGREIVTSDPIRKTIELLKQGRIVAIKGLGGFHLAVDATQEEAVRRLRRRKHREEKPLALMSPNLEAIRQYAHVLAEEEQLLVSPQRPIVLLEKKFPHPIAPSVAPNNRYFGVMLPYTPLHHLILEGSFVALVMTSGNLTEEPIAIGNEEALRRLGNIADFFLLHDRDILIRSDDSVYRLFAGETLPIRRARGYVPLPVFLPWPLPSLLACGAELKNTFCLTKGDCAFVSQHIGDMENFETLQYFEEILAHLQKILEIDPKLIAYDLHPRYLSTQWALEQKGIPKIGVQHHHAHIAACMAENGVDEPVIGIALDGTGYGTDGRIWGGEFLQATYTGFERLAHFEYLPMPGGEKAVREPWRMALSYLFHTYGWDLFEQDIPFLRELDEKSSRLLLKMTEQSVNSPLTSSCGRLFEGVSALLGIRRHNAFEGQAAMELEMALTPDEGSYPLRWEIKRGVGIIQVRPIIEALVEDIRSGVSAGKISARFHNTLIRGFGEICRWIRERTKISTVALSGGCFQNLYLLRGLMELLEREGFRVLIHRQVPPNDGGISLGQAVIVGRQAALR